jgi:hypothetical protein
MARRITAETDRLAVVPIFTPSWRGLHDKAIPGVRPDGRIAFPPASALCREAGIGLRAREFPDEPPEVTSVEILAAKIFCYPDSSVFSVK